MTSFRNDQKNIFGRTEREQKLCWEQEKHAWFSLVTPESIMDTVHMCHTFKSGTSDLDYGVWLQTVVLF